MCSKAFIGVFFTLTLKMNAQPTFSSFSPISFCARFSHAHFWMTNYFVAMVYLALTWLRSWSYLVNASVGWQLFQWRKGRVSGGGAKELQHHLQFVEGVWSL